VQQPQFVAGNRAQQPHMRRQLISLRRDASGTTAIEYAMIVLFIGLVVITLQNSIGDSVRGFFESVATGL
jgi:Flp pilus assembly pilin Flp